MTSDATFPNGKMTISEKARWLATALAFAAGLAVSACDGDTALGPASFGDERVEISGLTVVPEPGAGSELELPARPGGVEPGPGIAREPGLDDDRGPLHGDEDHR